MAGIEEKKQEQPHNQEKIALHEKPQNLEESIAVLEERLKLYENKKLISFSIEDLSKSEIINQINQLKEVENRYKKLYEIGIEKDTKIKLDSLVLGLGRKIDESSLLGDKIVEIKEELSKEEDQRQDTLIGKSTIRDYVEKYIKFDGGFFGKKLNNIRETPFMTLFYDTFAFNYISYLKSNYSNEEYELIKNNLGSKEKLELKNEGDLEKLVEKTLMSLIEKGHKIEDLVIINGDKSIKLSDNRESLSYRVYEEIKLDMEKINKSTSREDIDNINNRILNYENLEKKSSNTTEDSYLDNLPSVQELREEYRKRIILLMRAKSESLRLFINKVEPLVLNDLNSVVKIELQNLEKLKSKFTISNDEFDINYESNLIKLILGTRVNLGLKLDLNKIDDVLVRIDEGNVGSFMETLNDIIKNINDNTNIEKPENSMSISKQIIQEALKDKVERLKERLIEKLLSVYQKKAGLKQIDGRQSIKDSDFILILRKAVNENEISGEMMNDIIRKGYNKAFGVEFSTPVGKESMGNLIAYENVWSKIFSNELKDIIGPDKAKNLFLLSFIESSTKLDTPSEKGAVGRFQMLPSTAIKIITPEMTHEKKQKMISEYITKLNNDLQKDKITIKMKPKDLLKRIKNNDKEIGRYKQQTNNLSDNAMTIKILEDPILSAKVSAKYIRTLIQEEQKNGGSKNIDDIILRAILKYNGEWSNRLNSVGKINSILSMGIDKLDQEIIKQDKEFKKSIVKKEVIGNKTVEPLEVKKIIDDLAILLDKCKQRILTNKLSIKDCIEELKTIDNIFFDPEKIKSGVSNFQIVDDYFEKNSFVDKNGIIGWIDTYTKTILNQQYTYPIQFDELLKVYNALRGKK